MVTRLISGNTGFEGRRNTFEKAVKLPKPINSISDDFCFIINSNTNSGYFSSKRDGGKGDDDVYYFDLKE